MYDEVCNIQKQFKAKYIIYKHTTLNTHMYIQNIYKTDIDVYIFEYNFLNDSHCHQQLHFHLRRTQPHLMKKNTHHPNLHIL